MGTWLDVNAPDTAWHGRTEDPIPVVFGRYSATAAFYRWWTCRPMDGYARTNATFWQPGTRALTRTGRTAPHNYWPGWKRGLLLTRVPPLLGVWTGVVAVTEWQNISDPWWLDPPAPALGWVPLLGYGGWRGGQYVLNFQHERHYLRPIKHAVIATLRTRDSVKVEIPRGMVRGRDENATGKIFLPVAHSLPDGDRENLLTVVRERLVHEAADARWNMEGTRPHMELFTPPQPPPIIPWESMVQHADPVSPYLGHSAHGPVHWDLGDDSPHLGVGGGSGSGKSELVSAVVAQFMRGGAGVVVLDPKYASHRWLMGVPQVLYCTEPAMLHDTILWLDEELRRRGRLSQISTAEEPRIVVLLEERNSMQTLLREHWFAVRPKGAQMRSPALAALDRLSSQGRSLNINVILAAQSVAQVDIGSRNSYGAFCVAGRMPINAWRLIMGPGAKKPAMSSKPGRFGYVTIGTGLATVFQAAFPDLKNQSARLLDFALSGDAPLNIQEMMQQQGDTHPFPSWEPASSDDITEELVTLREFSERDDVPYTLSALRLHSQRDGRGFPDSQGTGEQGAKLYRLDDLYEWLTEKRETGSL